MIETCTAFRGTRRIATGTRAELVKELREHEPGVLVFEDTSGRVVDLDWRAPVDAAQPAPKPRRGRPRLGVVPREVTLLPRHWDWLSRQPGGASQALRRLVDEARKADGGRSARRAAQERTYRFMSAMGGDFAGFEEAARKLFAGDGDGFAEAITAWPEDLRDYAMALSRPDQGKAE